MQHREWISELRGLLAVSLKEGAELGTVSQVWIEPATRRVSGLSLRQGIGRAAFVPIAAVQAIGRQIAFVQAEEDATPIDLKHAPTGRSLHQMQGLRVTTSAGKSLGLLVDFDVDPADWSIVELRLADGRALPVVAAEITLGDDEVIVPPGAANKVGPAKSAQPGLLQRMLGKEPFEQIKEALHKVGERVRGKPAPAEKPAPPAGGNGGVAPPGR
jgi:sporulation protein YlmC with PRC-barrel domain